jgi:hypothetical protein
MQIHLDREPARRGRLLLACTRQDGQCEFARGRAEFAHSDDLIEHGAGRGLAPAQRKRRTDRAAWLRNPPLARTLRSQAARAQDTNPLSSSEQAMQTTLSIIKADVGSIGGHVAPSEALVDTIAAHIENDGRGLLMDHFIGTTGDDIAILMTHDKGVVDESVHRLAWAAFRLGSDAARREGLYGAGQDLLVDAFSGNVRGMGPAVAELQFEERAHEPFLMFMADKTERSTSAAGLTGGSHAS